VSISGRDGYIIAKKRYVDNVMDGKCLNEAKGARVIGLVFAEGFCVDGDFVRVRGFPQWSYWYEPCICTYKC